MKQLTLRRIAEACGGILHIAPGMEEAELTEIASITTDSRKAFEGSLFAAIKGERVDGHSFIPQVFKQGAVCVLSEQPLENAAGCWIYVRSTLDALKEIAEEYLRILQIPVVGITGSVGKTSTKEMIASVLSERYHVLKTAGNFNNELGLPLTVFRLTEEHEVAVLEMGISHFGEMHRLAKIARPDICVITNIGQCHLEFLHDRDGVLRAKTEIFDFLREDAGIVLNGNDDKLSLVTSVQGIRPVYYGVPEEAGGDVRSNTGVSLSVWAEQIRPEGLRGTACTIHTDEGAFEVLVPLPGRHMVMNALAAAAVGRRCGLSNEQIRRGIEKLEPVSGRLHIIHTDKYDIVDDCYNANPVSVKASLDVLRDVEGPTAAILGDMAELGPDEIPMHRECGVHAAHCGLDRLIGIGERCKALIEAAKETDPSLQAVHYDSVDAFLEQGLQDIPEKAAVLVKASHCMAFDRIVQALEDGGKGKAS